MCLAQAEPRSCLLKFRWKKFCNPNFVLPRLLCVPAETFGGAEVQGSFCVTQKGFFSLSCPNDVACTSRRGHFAQGAVAPPSTSPLAKLLCE